MTTTLAWILAAAIILIVMEWTTYRIGHLRGQQVGIRWARKRIYGDSE